MLTLYMSGSGNTKHCAEKLTGHLDKNAQILPIESKETPQALERHDTVILAYPVHYSNIPYMVRDIINKNEKLWKGKKVFCLATMGAFSGDGAGCAARLLKKYGAEISGGLHLKMPDSIGDVKLLKKSFEQNLQIINETDKKIERAAKMIRSGKYPQEGLSIWAHIAGLFGQRLWFSGKTKGYSDKLKISSACVGCGLCEKLCPMGNISIKDSKAVASDKCTMCYRCINKCPQKAITLIGDKVYEQCGYEKYIR